MLVALSPHPSWEIVHTSTLPRLVATARCTASYQNIARKRNIPHQARLRLQSPDGVSLLGGNYFPKTRFSLMRASGRWGTRRGGDGGGSRDCVSICLYLLREEFLEGKVLVGGDEGSLKDKSGKHASALCKALRHTIFTQEFRDHARACEIASC